MNIFSNTVCVTACSSCFSVANDCPNYYMMEFTKVVSVLHHRVRADLPEMSKALGLDVLTHQPTELCDHGKMLLLSEFCDFFLPVFGQPLCTEKVTVIFSPRLFWSFCPCCYCTFVAMAPLEAVTAPWSVQPNVLRGRRDDTGGWWQRA